MLRSFDQKYRVIHSTHPWRADSEGMPKRDTKASLYRGILKHKEWRPNGGFGTLCPKWTHQADDRGFAGEPHTHPWHLTVAHQLFCNSTVDAAGHRYAARNGIAFKAQASNDGTWHGYPVPWHEVPFDIQEALIDRGQAIRRDMKRQRSIDIKNIRWALKSDEE
jgi:hypothetical protein